MEQETMWILAVVALAIGILIGYLLGGSGRGDDQRKRLEEELNGSRTEMDRYKTEVAAHFQKTATLVNQLTEQYREVHQHLAKSADELCSDAKTRAALEDAFYPRLEKAVTDEAPASSPQPNPDSDVGAVQASPVPEAPRDYAPKKPEDPGTLSANYGLKKQPDDASTPPQPDPGLPETEVTDKRAKA